MNFVKKIMFDQSFKVRDESYKATADDMKSDVNEYFKNAEQTGKQDKILFSMTGNNGTGKTTFIKDFLIPELEEEYDVKYYSILNILDTYEPNQADLKDKLYQKVVQDSHLKGLKFLSTKMDVLSVVMTFIIGTLWATWSTLMSQYTYFTQNPIFHNPGMDVFFGISLFLSVLYIILLVYNFIFSKNQNNTKIGRKLKKAGANDKKKIYFIDDLSRIPVELEKEVMIKLASMRDYAHNEVDSMFFLVNSNGLVIDDDADDDFINKFVYQIYDMQFDKNLIISIFTNRVHEPTTEDMQVLNSVGNLRDLNAYITRLKDNITSEKSAITSTTDKEIKHHLLKRMADLEAAKKDADDQLVKQTEAELAKRQAVLDKQAKSKTK